MKKLLKSPSSVLILALAIAVTVALGAAALNAAFAEPAAGNETLAAQRIAVCDIAVVFEKYSRREEERKRLQTMNERADARVRLLENNLERLRAEIETLPLGSDQRLQRKQQAAEMEESLRAEKQTAVKECAQSASRTMKSIYDDILAAVAGCAGEHNIDLVVKQQKLDFEEGILPEGVMSMISMQTVLYNKPDMDITADVIERVNNRWTEAARNPEIPAANPESKEQP